MLLVLHFALSADNSLAVLRKKKKSLSAVKTIFTFYLSENCFLGKVDIISPLK